MTEMAGGDVRHPTLGKMFEHLQKQLRASLEASRDVIDHAPTMGAASENRWLEMLKDHMPERYAAERAFVVDSRGAVSQQQDIVIFDRQYSPLLFRLDEALYVPAESVYGVLEVKQELDARTLKYAGVKAASVRNLVRSSAPIVHAGGVYEAREPFAILSGIVALESSWNPPLGDAFHEVLEGLSSAEHIDLGCALNHGAFSASVNDSRFVVETRPGETALVFFFLKLLEKLQALGTVPAIDLSVYAKAVEA